MRITRLYIDNYKCFVGFDFKPQAIQPIFGLNGTGKSTLFEVLAALRLLIVDGISVNDCFPLACQTRWSESEDLEIILEVGDDTRQYSYELLVMFNSDVGRTWVNEETLRAGSHELFSSLGGEGTLTPEGGGASHKLLVDRNRSSLASVNPRPDTQSVTHFKQWLGSLQLVTLHPGLMRESVSQAEASSLDWGGPNFVSWLRYITQTRLPAMGPLSADLRGCVSGLNAIRFEPVGKQWTLWADFNSPTGGKPDSYQFGELSDGQRMLIALYTVYHGMKESNAVLCMDEPANYLAAAEIQPYLSLVRDAVGDGFAQLFVSTHNPEAINYLAPDGGVIFDREDGGPVKILPFPEVNPDGITAAELLARGWID
jgi:predicted ATPase